MGNVADGKAQIEDIKTMDLRDLIDDNGECIIPDGVTRIGDYAFWGCTKLTSIKIPDNVTEIGFMAFRGCIGLTSIEIPNTVEKIGFMAFAECSKLTSVEIPASVTRIEDLAFGKCVGLTSIEIPDSTSRIGEWTFCGCPKLTSIVISKNNPNFKSINNCCISKNGDELIFGCKNSIIPESVKIIGGWAFSGCSELTSITIPPSVTKIGNRAFERCTELTSIEIPDNVMEIGNEAFLECTKLTSVSILIDKKSPEMSKNVLNILIHFKPSVVTLKVPIGCGYAYRHHPDFAEKFKEVLAVLD